MNRLIQYLKDTRGELKHVSWPTRRQAMAFTLLVILVSLVTAGILGGFDFFFSRAIQVFVL